MHERIQLPTLPRVYRSRPLTHPHLPALSYSYADKHHPWDVVMGAFVGSTVTMLLFPRAARMHNYMVYDLAPQAALVRRREARDKRIA